MKLQIPLKQYVRLLRNYLKPQSRAMAGLAVLLLSSTALQLISPQLIRYFIDTAKQLGGGQKLTYAAIWFIVVSLLSQGISVWAAYLGENIGWIATNRLREDVAEHCLSLDMGFHKSHTSGSLIERVDGDINSLTNFFSSFVINLLSNLLLMIGILVLLFREGWIIGAGISLFAVFALFAIQHIRKYAAPYWGRLRQMSAKFYGF